MARQTELLRTWGIKILRIIETNSIMKSKPILSSNLVATAEAVRQFRRRRWNPLRHVSPQMLARVLESFECGDLREFCILAETVAERDETIKCVKSKREKSVAARPWEILLTKESTEAHKHAVKLREFWERARAVNAFDRNERGGVGRLIKQMMSATSFRYSVHHLVWKSVGGQLSATFEFVPLCFFKNDTGRLRFMRHDSGDGDEELKEGEWMTTTGDGLMIAGLAAYIAKRYGMQDWLAFSEKFSMPGIVGTTSAAKGSPEGIAMKAAVEAFGQDWSAVMYGVQDPSKLPLHLIQPNGSPSEMPMPELVERIDRRLAMLWRGGDLSSMSSNSGAGTGASLQAEAAWILAVDDCQMISEACREVERTVIAWHFGEGTEPLAQFHLMPPNESDKRDQLSLIQGLTKAGARIGRADAAKRLGLRLARDTERAFGDLF